MGFFMPGISAIQLNVMGCASQATKLSHSYLIHIIF